MKIEVGLPGRDQLRLEYEIKDGNILTSSLHAIGCMKMLRLASKWRTQLSGALNQIPLPDGIDHASLLLRELLLRAQGRWVPPYTDDEICHCRAVPTSIVEASIIAGAHTSARVTRETTASSQCGTCRPDVEQLIAYRLKHRNASVK